MITLSSTSKLDSTTKTTIGTAATYAKAAYEMIGKIKTEALSITQSNDIRMAMDSIQDSIINMLSALTDDNVPTDINELIEASE